MKTDISKIITVSGKHGLYKFVAQARGGVIAEALDGGKRTVFDAKSRLSSLADIAIYTTEEELKLEQVFTAMKEVLGGAEAPTSKAADADLKALFLKAIPNYDDERFYVSHMRKVVDWYNELLKFASLDFEKEEEEATSSEA